MTAARPRIGVVGTGWWASEHHIPALARSNKAELGALIDSDRERLEAVAAAFDGTPAFADLTSAIGADAIDAVVVATPAASHHAIASAALSAGLHVLVEKPLTATPQQAADLLRRARARGRHAMAGYPYQLTRAARRLRAAVASGELGAIELADGAFTTAVEAFYRGAPEEYRTVLDYDVHGPTPETYSQPGAGGGGHAHTQLTHLVGLLLWALDAAPVAVSAFARSRSLSVDLVDSAAFELDGGTIGTISGSGALPAACAPRREVDVIGTRGTARLDLDDASLELCTASGTERVEPAPGEAAYPADEVVERFAAVIGGAAENPAPLLPAARAVAFTHAALTSAASGARVAPEQVEGEEADR